MEAVEAFKKIGQGLGLVESSEVRAQRIAEENLYLEKMQRLRQEKDLDLHMLSKHSDACLGEIEYVMGISNRNPHPSHSITFRPCNCEQMNDASPIF